MGLDPSPKIPADEVFTLPFLSILFRFSPYLQLTVTTFSSLCRSYAMKHEHICGLFSGLSLSRWYPYLLRRIASIGELQAVLEQAQPFLS